ncbi:cytosolic carboxypeptidase 2, partial [Megalops cyprinoides]|uniref:cytosolic carboxypeptidase 2 n=1 Tax=Megalops cyprinoides TaxID=118141 RepID=UPI0018651BF3
MCPALKTHTEIQISDDPYESFMLHHLQHYGLFTDQRASFQRSLSPSSKWGQDHGSALSDNSPETNESGSDTQEEDSEISRRPFSLTLEQALRTRQLVFDFDGGRHVPRLREPQSLFAIQSLGNPHRGVRWPIECEVIKEAIQHIEWEPPEPELFYRPTGYERTPMPVGPEKGRVVYCIDSATKNPYFTFARVGGSRGPVKNATSNMSGRDDSILEFESRFESGNLLKAVHVGVHDYELTLRPDLYTNKHTQWFYFRVRNMKVGVTYRFTIINLMKSSSLYNLGMKPLLYSEQAAQMQGVGWQRVGTNIKYYRNQREHEGHALYSLTWTCQFPYERDICYFAHCYPYTYSDLQRYLTRVASDPVTATYCKLRVLCQSLADNAVYVLTVTSPSPSREAGRAKRAVVVTARVHPGETNSSWMMQGFLDFLLGDSLDARLLRDTFVFKVVPMLNPDGVVVGNYRCSLAGRDLNRNYRTLLRDSFPCVWHTRNMVKRVMAEREVVLYCDFHGHSRKNNVFMYGCDNRSNAALRFHERVFPLMMSKNITDKFSYRSCKFRVQKSKEGTGRIVMWKLGISNSYTMESTFGGSTLGKRKGTLFTTQDLKSLGYYFCDTLLDYCDPDQTKANHCLVELGAMFRQEICQKLGRDVDSDGSLSSISVSDIESSTSGSNSTESNGLPVHLLNMDSKKKHLKTRKERNRLRQERVQYSEAKITNQNIKHAAPVPSTEEAAKAGIQGALIKSKKGKKASSRGGQTWI